MRYQEAMDFAMRDTRSPLHAGGTGRPRWFAGRCPFPAARSDFPRGLGETVPGAM